MIMDQVAFISGSMEDKMTVQVKRSNTFSIFVLKLFRIGVIAILITSTTLFSSTSLIHSAAQQVSSVGLATTSLTFIAEADAQVNESSPNANYGISTFLQVDGATDPDVESFVRFTVTGVSGTVQSAQVRVYDTTNASTNGPAIYATGISWTETAITWNTRPGRLSGALDNKGSLS